jgi:hypothetical protein
MPVLTYNPAQVTKLLLENKAKLVAEQKAAGGLRVAAREEYRLAVLAFAKKLTTKGSILHDPKRFERTVFRDWKSPDKKRRGYDRSPCLARLGPPELKKPTRSEEDLEHFINRINHRLTAMAGMDPAKKFRMSELRFTWYVEGKNV